MPKNPKRNKDFDWAAIIQKGMQAAHTAYMAEVRKYKPSNPRSATYSEDVSKWQHILNLPNEAQSLSLEGIRKQIGAPRNTSNSAELEKLKKEMAKINESKAKVEADFDQLEKKYKDLDGKYKKVTKK